MMPIRVDADLRRPSQTEFAGLAYDLMECAFAVHNEIGRFFDEKIYKRVVAQRFGGVELEVPVVVSFDGFEKRYSLDMLVRGTAVFEWKAVDALADEHRAQLLNYLLLSEMPHAKLVNVRPESVEHEFVNTTLLHADRSVSQIDDRDFQPLADRDQIWKDWLSAALRDWGTRLDVHLYEQAIAHVFGGEEQVLQDIDIVVAGAKVGEQKARLTGPGVAFKVTTLHENLQPFEKHARRFLAHTSLRAVQWVNVGRRDILFKTLRQKD
jgi:GxxExxY protein